MDSLRLGGTKSKLKRSRLPGGNLSAFRARLLTAYPVYFNRRHRRVAQEHVRGQ
jgi:hypothetical protein